MTVNNIDALVCQQNDNSLLFNIPFEELKSMQHFFRYLHLKNFLNDEHFTTRNILYIVCGFIDLKVFATKFRLFLTIIIYITTLIFKNCSLLESSVISMDIEISMDYPFIC